MISTVIFDYGGVISSPLFVGIGAFEEAEGFAKGSLLELLFGETHYIGVEGRAVAAEAATETIDAVAADPDALAASGELADEPDWHLLEKGQIDVATYFERMVEKAPEVLGKPLDMDAYGRFWRSTAPGVHWMVVHKMPRAEGPRPARRSAHEQRQGVRRALARDRSRSRLCDDVVDSSHVGVRKPERAIYELTCARMAITPTEAVFVDDNADNIAAARAYGMEAVHFGEEPWDALAELDAILDRRGVTTQLAQAARLSRRRGARCRARRPEGTPRCTRRLRRRVLDPLARVGDDGLTGADLELTVAVPHEQRAGEHDGELVEVGRLRGLGPAGRAAHVRDAGRVGAGVDASDVLVDQLRRRAGRLDAGRSGDVGRSHACPSVASVRRR